MLNEDQRLKVFQFDLPRDGWVKHDDNSVVLLLANNEFKSYQDRWRIDASGSSVIWERKLSTPGNGSEQEGEWKLMCPDCGYLVDSVEHESGGF